MLVIRDREAGNIIEEVETREEGLQLIAQYEAEDKKDGTYEEDFYEVAEIEETRLAVKRKLKGLSQSKLAELSGVSVRMIQHYEQGTKDINVAKAVTVHRLAYALECAGEELLEL